MGACDRLAAMTTPLLVMMAIIGGVGLVGTRHAPGGMNSVYRDRVVPLRDIKAIADMYAVNVADTTHKLLTAAATRRPAGQAVGRASARSAQEFVRF